MKNTSVKSAKMLSDLPLTLTRHWIYVFPTRYGLVFSVVLAAMLIASINYGNNLGFLLTFLLGSLVFVSIFHSYRNLFGLRIESAYAKPVFPGEYAQFEFVIKNTSSFRYAVSFYFKHELSEAYIVESMDSGELKAVVPSKALKRGFFNPGVLVIETVFPLGLFRAWSRLNLNLNCLVYPSPMPGPIVNQITKFSEKEGTILTNERGTDDFQGLAEYQPGDSIQHIHWKAYAGGKGLQIKRFGKETGAAMLIDWDLIREINPEVRISRMCGMVLNTEKEKRAYGLSLPGFQIPPDSGVTHRHNCLKALALYSIDS